MSSSPHQNILKLASIAIKTSRVFMVLSTALAPGACRISGVPPPDPNPETSRDLVLVPAGWFWMGEEDGRASNQPRHRVYLDAYEIHRTEVTRTNFAGFISDTGYQAADWPESVLVDDSNLPVVGILWKEADAYCRWLGMRLPSEAEWEKGARGDDARRYPWGDEWDAQKANTAEGGVGDVLPVGSFPDGASPYGLLDMCGNAAEWVADVYDPAYYQISPESNPTGPRQVMDQVLRGGSFDSPSKYATTYFRDSSHSARPNPRVGFRCARSASEVSSP